MEINITEFFNTANAFDYSASRMELGDNAGQITWHNACNADFTMLDTEEKLQALREYAKGYGAWNDAEIAAWSNNECNALFIQFVSSNIRDAGLDVENPDWQAYEQDENKSGRICKCIDGEIYFSLSK